MRAGAPGHPQGLLVRYCRISSLLDELTLDRAESARVLETLDRDAPRCAMARLSAEDLLQALPTETLARPVAFLASDGDCDDERGRLMMRIRSPGPQRAAPPIPNELRQPGRRGHQVESGAIRAALGKGL